MKGLRWSTKVGMSLGVTPPNPDLFRSTRELCEPKLGATSIYRLLAEQGHRLFADHAFADLFEDIGRRSVPPHIVATVMVLQRIEGASDREAVDRFAFDLRWKYAAGVDLDFPAFAHTVLVDMRARLRGSEEPNRIFEAALEMAKGAGLVGRKRVLDSTALYDAVATQDTVTMIRSAIRGLLGVVDDELEAQLRTVLKRDDDYKTAGKPACDWDDAKAREALVDELARDGYAALWTIDDRKLVGSLRQAAELLATVLGQDLEQRDDGVFRIARRVATDRVISTVDPEARHGHKTAARGFDGYKGHIAIDPDSEIITATEVTAGNVGDAVPAETLLSDVLAQADEATDTTVAEQAAAVEPAQVYGDASYGTAELVEKLEAAGIEADTKVQPPSARDGKFSQDDFHIDLDARTVQCPAGRLIQLRVSKDGAGEAQFGAYCNECPLRAKCTDSKGGRTVRVHPKHRTLDRSRKRQRDPDWKKRYRATRPKVERKIAHLMRRKHGGRRARMRGRLRVGQDFALLAAAVNLARLAQLGVRLRTAALP
jgi:IS5 family transposase